MFTTISTAFAKKVFIVSIALLTLLGGVTAPAHAAGLQSYTSSDLQSLLKQVTELTTLLSGDITETATTSLDTDSDGIDDTVDNCPAVSNANQLDIDTDGQGDVCDLTPRGQVVIVPGPSGDIPGIKSNLKILFVGNSYTYAALGGVRSESPYGMFMRMIKLKATDATFTLSVIGSSVMSELWNWTGKPVRTDPKILLKTGTYDLLVLQSGDGFLTKTVPGSYDIYADLFANLAKDNGTNVMLYGVWPFDNMISVSKGETVATAADVLYKQTAMRNNIGYAAAGKAYTDAYIKFTELYGNGDDGKIAETILTYDSVHAAPPTAYLAANMMYLSAFGVHPPTPAEFLPVGVSLDVALVLQGIAIAAHNRHSTQTSTGWYQ